MLINKQEAAIKSMPKVRKFRMYNKNLATGAGGMNSNRSSIPSTNRSSVATAAASAVAEGEAAAATYPKKGDEEKKVRFFSHD